MLILTFINIHDFVPNNIVNAIPNSIIDIIIEDIPDYTPTLILIDILIQLHRNPVGMELLLLRGDCRITITKCFKLLTYKYSNMKDASNELEVDYCICSRTRLYGTTLVAKTTFLTIEVCNYCGKSINHLVDKKTEEDSPKEVIVSDEQHALNCSKDTINILNKTNWEYHTKKNLIELCNRLHDSLVDISEKYYKLKSTMEDQRNTFEELNEPNKENDILLDRLAKTLSDHPKLNKGMNKAVGDFVNRSYPGTNGTPIEVNFHNPYTGLTSEDFIVDNEGYNKHGIKPSEGMVSFIERNPPEYNKLTKESYNKLTKESFDEFIKTLLDHRCIQIPNPLYKLSSKETADQYAKDHMLLNQGIHIDQPTTSYTRDPWQPSSIIDEKEYKISDISISKPSIGTLFKVTYQYLKRLFNI